MALENFIPEVWASSIITNFRKRGVLVGLANREYEGQLASGNTIHIPGIVDVEIKDYKAAGRTTSPDDVEDTEIDLVIDQEKSFDFYVDDIDKAQAKYGVDPYTESAAAGLLDDAEEFLTASLVTGGTTITGATAVTDWSTAYAAVKRVRRALNDRQVPFSGRRLVINSAFEEFLLDDESKLTAADTAGSSEGLREATIGRILGFDVVVNQYSNEEAPQAIGMLPSTLAYVSQISKIEPMRAENKFADRLRGLHVYGGKVLRPMAAQIYTGV